MDSALDLELDPLADVEDVAAVVVTIVASVMLDTAVSVSVVSEGGAGRGAGR